MNSGCLKPPTRLPGADMQCQGAQGRSRPLCPVARSPVAPCRVQRPQRCTAGTALASQLAALARKSCPPPHPAVRGCCRGSPYTMSSSLSMSTVRWPPSPLRVPARSLQKSMATSYRLLWASPGYSISTRPGTASPAPLPGHHLQPPQPAAQVAARPHLAVALNRKPQSAQLSSDALRQGQ